MKSFEFGSFEFVIDYVGLAFIFGLIISYLYYRKRQVSIGGSLAVGYLAGLLYQPINSVATVGTAIIAYYFIHFVILKFFLPRPRFIFAIGLMVGIVCGAIWQALSYLLFGQQNSLAEPALVGVVMPGMITNSFVRQGIKKR